MTTIRRGSRPSDNLTLIANGFLRDATLSLAARGLGAQLLSHRDGWEITTAGLARSEGIGRDKLRGYMRELEDAGYLIRERARLPGGRFGDMLYEIHDTPQIQENPRPDLRLEGQALAGQAPAWRPHKKTTSKKTINPKKNNPSGGATAAAAPPSLGSPSIAEEEPMSPSALSPSLDQFELFAAAEPSPAKAKDAGKPKQPPSPSAGSVVAAFVDSYRKHHSGGDPVKSAIGRVARDAKMMIDEGRAAATELERAASEMGSGPYANLPVALDKLRQKPARRTAGVPARPHTDPHWQEVEQRTRREYRESLLTDDDMIRWTKRFPSEVDKVLTEWPELADRFRDVA